MNWTADAKARNGAGGQNGDYDYRIINLNPKFELSDDVWNFQCDDGLERAIMLANNRSMF